MQTGLNMSKSDSGLILSGSRISPREAALIERLKTLKMKSGSHSPSMTSIQEQIPEIEVKIDACFLSNPYATDLFMDFFQREVIATGRFRSLIECYPSQNRVISELLAPCLNTSAENIFIGNGAIEIIQAVVHRFAGKRMLVNLPTFSSYYEFATESMEVMFNVLDKEDNFRLDLQACLKKIRDERIDSVVLINPNNPDGSYLRQKDVRDFVRELKHLKSVIIDESFIHFAAEDDSFELKSTVALVNECPNLAVIKSMSKDFGIAGLRAGYAVMSADRVRALLSNGYLWNSSGLSEYFFRLYVRPDFRAEYEKVRVRYIKETQGFLETLKSIPGMRVYPSQANFVLAELLSGECSDDFVNRLLVTHGVYVRTCSDKIGLKGQFIRVASRNWKENEGIIAGLRYCLEQ